MQPIPFILPRIKLQHLLPRQPRPLQLSQMLKHHPLLHIEADLAVRAPPAVERVEELFDFGSGADSLLHGPACELQLVAPVGQPRRDERFGGVEGFGGGVEGGADCEDVGYEGGEPEGYAVYDGSALSTSRLAVSVAGFGWWW